SRELGEKMVALERQAFELAGEEFNLGSPKQLCAILYEKHALPVLAKTAKGQPSTAESVLAELADQGHALPQVIMQHRTLSKLKSTYTDRLPEQPIRRPPARADQPAHRPWPHQLATGADRHRPAALLGPEPAEPPGPRRRRAAHPPGLRRPRGLPHHGRGLFAGRAAHHGPPG